MSTTLVGEHQRPVFKKHYSFFKILSFQRFTTSPLWYVQWTQIHGFVWENLYFAFVGFYLSQCHCGKVCLSVSLWYILITVGQSSLPLSFLSKNVCNVLISPFLMQIFQNLWFKSYLTYGFTGECGHPCNVKSAIHKHNVTLSLMPFWGFGTSNST